MGPALRAARRVKTLPLWLACLGLLACDAGPVKSARRLVLASAAAGACERGTGAAARNLHCACVTMMSETSLSDDELRLWKSAPELFSVEELRLLALREAAACYAPAFITGCVRGGRPAPECACIAERVLEEASGSRLVAAVDALEGSAPLPPELARLVSRCEAGPRGRLP